MCEASRYLGPSVTWCRAEWPPGSVTAAGGVGVERFPRPVAPREGGRHRPTLCGVRTLERKWLILSSVSLGTFMATLDGSIVNISLPKIQDAFGIGISTVEWVSVGYLLVVGAFLLPFGRLGEILTFKRIYLAGFVLFTVASVLCGLAPSAETLIVFRAIQGVGAAMLQAMGPAIVARTFGPGERGRALGLNAISVSIGLSLGPALGGFLTEIGTWRAIFFVNVPVGVLAVLWAQRVLPAERGAEHVRFDVAGAALSSVGLLGLLLALSEGQGWGWTSPAVIAPLALFAVCAASFVWVETHAAQPMLDLRLFRIRPFAVGNLSVVVAFVGLFTATFLLPFFLENGAGFSALDAGLLLTPIPITQAIVAPFSGAVSDRIGQRVPASLGIAILVAGLVSLTQLPTTFEVGDLVWRLVLVGFGMGLFMSPNSSAVLGSVPRPRIGTASGTLAQMRIDGQALGIALSSAVVAIRLPIHAAELANRVGPGVAQADALILAIHDAFLVAAIVCSIGIVASFFGGSVREARGEPAGSAPG
jgi:EmrB/QacA subfamily drug resistance transporter